MKLDFANGSHLTYCTNIHPGESLAEITANLRTHATAIRRRLCPEDEMFGLGLRLSHVACCELKRPRALAEFTRFCREHGFYVFTINGFIYGRFHHTRVKDNVYLPDWSDPRRLEFTDDLAQILAQILPADATGSISTVPCGYKGHRNPSDLEPIATALIRHAATLYRILQDHQRRIVLALEPEPGCLLETVDETVDFFDRYLFSSAAARRLQRLIGRSPEFCENFLRRHLGICYDTCHMAIEYQEARAALATLAAHGITVGKVQLSSAPEIRFASTQRSALSWIERFDEPVYLHQVVEKDGDRLVRYDDLPQALEQLRRSHRLPEEWRLHFHVPIFRREIPPLATTQRHIVEALDYLRQRHECRHYEVETYTWHVLPPQYRDESVDAAITRELRWVMEKMGGEN